MFHLYIYILHRNIKIRARRKFTCCLRLSLSPSDFFVKLNKKDSGKIKAAFPRVTKPNKAALAPTNFQGLERFKNTQWREVVELVTINANCQNNFELWRYLFLVNFHFSRSNASIPTYRKINVSAIDEKVANVCLQVNKTVFKESGGGIECGFSLKKFLTWL